MKKIMALVLVMASAVALTGCVDIPETTYTVDTGIMYCDSGDVVRDKDTEDLLYKYEHEARKDM